jgi:hypothetical protein
MQRGGYPPVPAYTDIAHFRAPYKDAEMTGMSGCGFGFTPQPEPPGFAEELQGYTEVDKRGYTLWRSDYAKGIKDRLAYSRATEISADVADVSLVVTSEAEKKALKNAGQSGAQWLKRKLSEGKVVLASAATLGVVGVAQLVAVDKNDVDGIRNASQVVPVLDEPMKLSGAMLTAGGAVLFLLVGGALILSSVGSRRMRANPKKKKRAVKKAVKKAAKKKSRKRRTKKRVRCY